MSGSSQEFALAPGQATPEVPFVDVAGKTHSREALLARAKGLPLLLVFFKVSCPTCRLAWPYVQKLHAQYGGKAVHVAGVCQNTAAEGKAYYHDYGRATFDLFIDPEPGFPASNAYGIEAVPHFVLQSPDGKVQKVFTGWSKREMEALARDLAEAKKLAVKPLVPPSDLVVDWQAG